MFETQGPKKTGRWRVGSVRQVSFLSCLSLTANSGRRLEDNRWSWASMVKAERPLRQISAPHSHHDVITGTFSFHQPFTHFSGSFQVLFGGTVLEKTQSTFDPLYYTANCLATDTTLPPPSINLYPWFVVPCPLVDIIL